MNSDSFPLVTEGCDAIQWRISECADERLQLPGDIKTHVDSCEECAGFARAWFIREAGPARDLEASSTEAPSELRQRIVAEVTSLLSDAVIPFPAPRKSVRWSSVLARIAAVLAIGGLAFWLLDPHVTQREPVRSTATARIDPNTLLRNVAAIERPMTREKKALREAALDGADQLRDHLQWTFAMLEK